MFLKELTAQQRFSLRLSNVFELSDDERAAIHSIPTRIVSFQPRQEIVSEGEPAIAACFLLSGIACGFRTTSEGNRQITGFHVAGDAPDLQSLHLSRVTNSISAVSPCVVGIIQHSALLRLCEMNWKIAAALWRITLIDAGVHREWVVNLGQRKGPERLAHLFCELVSRLRAVHRESDGVFDLAMTQGDLGDAAGLSVVQVNRVIQTLRRRGLIALKAGSLKILNWEGLKALAGFDAAYLHLGEASANFHHLNGRVHHGPGFERRRVALT